MNHLEFKPLNCKLTFPKDGKLKHCQFIISLEKSGLIVSIDELINPIEFKLFIVKNGFTFDDSKADMIYIQHENERFGILFTKQRRLSFPPFYKTLKSEWIKFCLELIRLGKLSYDVNGNPIELKELERKANEDI